MEWIKQTLSWYGFLLILGIGFYPIARLIFSKWVDRGYAFSKILAIIIITYSSFLFGTVHIAPFTRTTIFIITGIWILFLYFVLPRIHPLRPLSRKEIRWIVIEEILCIAGIFFLAYMRGQESSIHSLEKFMDFGFINSILRSSYFPPKDMWLSADPSSPAGYAINYYYFGHMSGAMLIKLTHTAPAIGYNLILATILSVSLPAAFSITIQLATTYSFFAHKTFSEGRIFVVGMIGAFLLNFAGNLHTIYVFTSGYPNDAPVPFWQILAPFNPTHYWYPNATRFIPFTIHEFPSYSYVVADLHGHVFDIPFVLTTLALLFTIFMNIYKSLHVTTKTKKSIPTHWYSSVALIGAMLAIHYMTNALDGPIYLLVSLCLLFVFFQLKQQFYYHAGILIGTFVLVTLPFSMFFKPFASGIGVNCSPSFLTNIGRLGPFLFEKGNCQITPPWMFFVLWGFFWTHFVIFALGLWKQKKSITPPDIFISILFCIGTLLILIPEFFYVKDIYPVHFRANTMFKLGYQAYIMMSIASAYTMYRFLPQFLLSRIALRFVSGIFLFFVVIYPFFAFPSYYGTLDKTPQLDGSEWLKAQYPDNKEIVTYINNNIQEQPVILEAQGDSYTDYNHISAFTGIPTVAGWWVHEWLWRGSSDVVGKRIPEITAMYESTDPAELRSLLKKYHVQYIVVSTMEKEKYKNIQEDTIRQVSSPIFTTASGFGALYQVK